MKMFKGMAVFVAASLTAGAGSVALAHCGKCGTHEAKKNIVDTAASAGSFDTLVKAVKAAGLADTLASPGPFTVFAPTDEAFAKLGSDTLNKLLANPDQLGAILKYHVVSGKVLARDVVKLTEAKTLQGQKVRIDTSSGVAIDNARVVKADVQATNGVIHVIDTVLIPD